MSKRYECHIKAIECREGEPICCDESSDPSDPFLFFLCNVFQKGSPTSPFIHLWKKVLLRLPLSIFEKEPLAKLNVAPAQLHPDSWALIRAFTILCAKFDISPSVEVFLYFFEAKHTSRKLWVSLNGAPRRALISLFQSSYKKFKGKFVKVWATTGDSALLDGFPLYWTPQPKF